MLVVGFATGLGGGIARDVLLGALPPAGLQYKRYAIAAFAGAALVFLFSGPVQEIPTDVIVALDAAGLAPFAVSGARKALDYETNGLTAILLGGVTGVGGGVIRDLLLDRVPIILVADVYATAALAGAAVTTIGIKRGHHAGAMMALGAATCFALRMIGYWQHWNLPQ